ncbi:MAG: hypothetical protein EBT86_11860 [Actinobacteria bacterium]|nr:hypothetical protein [Actinomycetota bacterium]
MPNWCMNKLVVSHGNSDMVDRFEKAYNLGKACSEFLPLPEDEDWYNWQINNWGTKWDIGADVGTEKEERYGLKATRVGNEVCCSFDSAWSPPTGLYEALVELGYDVRATYWEPGMAFCGIWDNGADNYCEYSTRDMIPVALWSEYNMQEFFKDDEEVNA